MNNPPQMTQEPSPVKLPLAPILSTPLNATLSNNRRGSSIFSPTQTPPPPIAQNDVVRAPAPAPDPDPAPSNNTTPAPNLKIAVTPGPLVLSKPAAAASVTNSTSVTIRYKECLKNHAANMGGHVVDGCGEFMPSGEDGTPEAMKCAACECHRNFHRKEVEGEAPQSSRFYPYNNVPNSSGNNDTNNNNNYDYYCSTRAKYLQNQTPRGHAAVTTRMVNFGNAADQSSSEDLNAFDQGGGGMMQPGSKKRFRSKFSQEQKDRMHDFAVKLGWRMQKQDEQEVVQFCNEVGVKRQVFKVWMHNNKQAMKKTRQS